MGKSSINGLFSMAMLNNPRETFKRWGVEEKLPTDVDRIRVPSVKNQHSY